VFVVVVVGLLLLFVVVVVVCVCVCVCVYWCVFVVVVVVVFLLVCVFVCLSPSFFFHFLFSDYPEYAYLMKKYQGAFQNGAAFPDFGYSCPLKEIYPELPSASEAAHWVRTVICFLF